MSQSDNWHASECFRVDDEVRTCELSGDHVPGRVTKFISRRTGMSVILGETNGPVVDGFCVLATEAHDNKGLPHTLEHLIFLGSEDYPFKGVLDMAANRSFADGTNAWTDIDHTAYTISCAGAEGFLQMIGPYLDHILWPTLTDSAFHTEVHHVTGEGSDAGVVYCEMTAIENEASELVECETLRSLFPEPQCGYRAYTGGDPVDLRTLTNQEVIDYHRAFYRTDNLCVVVAGPVAPTDLLTALEAVELKELAKRETSTYVPIERPWSTQSAHFEKSVAKEIVFPDDDDESEGTVSISWFGPPMDDLKTLTFVDLLCEYLTDSPVSALEKRFVECDEPLCGSVSYDTRHWNTTVWSLEFDSVPPAHIDEIRSTFDDEMRSVVASGIDMSRMATVIKQARVKYLSRLERNPRQVVAWNAIHDFLHGKRREGDNVEELVAHFGEIERLNEATKLSADQWLELLKRWVIDCASVTVLARPSAERSEQVVSEENARVEKQKEELGAERLVEIAKELDEANERNNVPPPNSMIEAFSVPSATRLRFFPHVSVHVGAHAKSPADDEGKRLVARLSDACSEEPPLLVQIDHLPTKFVEVRVSLNTDVLDDAQRAYLELFRSLLFVSPVTRADGTSVPYEEVVREMNAYTIGHESVLGVSGRGSSFVTGDFSQLLTLRVKCEVEEYEATVRRLSEQLWGLVFDAERIASVASKLVLAVSQYRRHGIFMVASTSNEVNFDGKKGTNVTASSAIRQHRLLTDVLEDAQKYDAKATIAILEGVRESLLRPGGIRAQIVCDADALGDVKRPWCGTSFVKRALVDTPESPLPLSLKRDYVAQSDTDVIAPLGAVDSSYCVSSGKGPAEFGGLTRAALLLAMEYLTMLEGLFWKRIRGLGLSYGYRLALDEEAGLVHFKLHKSIDVVKAYGAAKTIVDEICTGSSKIDSASLDAARSSLVFTGVVTYEKTVAGAGSQALYDDLAGTRNRDLLGELEQVTLDDVLRAMEQFIAPLFDAKTSRLTVVCNPRVAQTTVDGFASDFGRALSRVDDLDEWYARDGTVANVAQ